MERKPNVVEKRLGRVLARYPSIQAVYLFGSHAVGRARRHSDLDLALVGPREELESCKLDILADLAAEGVDLVDLVLLDGADTILRFEAVHPNCLIYAKADFDHPAYFSRSLREYFDLQPYLKIQRESLKRRLLNDKA